MSIASVTFLDLLRRGHRLFGNVLKAQASGWTTEFYAEPSATPFSFVNATGLGTICFRRRSLRLGPYRKNLPLVDADNRMTDAPSDDRLVADLIALWHETRSWAETLLCDTFDLQNVDDFIPALVRIGIPRSGHCLLYTSPSPRDRQKSRMPSSA